MNALTSALPKGATIIEKDGVPDYVVLPYQEFLRLFDKAEALIPNAVVDRLVDGDTMVKAWREHFGLTQTEVATRLGITQAAYSKLENSAKLRPSSRRRIAQALGISFEQLVRV
jgi:DNA-binding XRE family transcriptional regulator